MATAQRMSNADAAWLHMDRPTNLMVITTTLWFDDPQDWDRVREVVRTRLVEPFPRFRQRVVEGRAPLAGPHWEDDPHFDLDLHLHHVALPKPGDRAALQELVGDLMATPLDRSKPLWHFHLVDGYGEGSAMVGRMHHCIADGIALARVLLSLTDETPDAGIAAAAEAGERRERRGGLPGPLGALARPALSALSAARGVSGALAHEAISVVKDPSQLASLAATARDDAGALAKMLLTGADARTVFKGELGVAQGVAWSDPIPLEDVKAAGHALDTTVNDILLSAVTGALRRYLVARDSLVEELRAFVPFNLRPLDQPLPRELGNRFGLVTLPLPIGMEDLRERLDEVHRRMDRIKHSPEGAVAYGVLGAMGSAPVQVEERIIDLFSAKATAVMTNVPGPRETVYLAGVPVRGVLVWAPCSGSVAMSVAIFSYAGEVTVGLMADAGLVPDPQEIVAAFQREARELLALEARARQAGETPDGLPGLTSMRDARQEAFDRLGGRYEVRVLEPSPPAVAEGPWFADDPAARGEVPTGRELVSPVTTGDVTWDELAAGDRELAEWCAERWLGAWRPLAPVPAGLAATRTSLHHVAEHVMKPARERANGKIALRYARGGFGTPFFGDDVQVRVEGAELIVDSRDGERRAPLTTLAAAAAHVGVPLEIADSHLVVDPQAARFLGDWYGFTAAVLEQLRAEAGAELEPSRVQLWPEHFDLATELGAPDAGMRAGFGGSPGDEAHAEPYLYVVPWSAERAQGQGWNSAAFPGAELSYADLLAAADGQREAALAFFRGRLRALTG